MLIQLMQTCICRHKLIHCWVPMQHGNNGYTACPETVHLCMYIACLDTWCLYKQAVWNFDTDKILLYLIGKHYNVVSQEYDKVFCTYVMVLMYSSVIGCGTHTQGVTNKARWVFCIYTSIWWQLYQCKTFLYKCTHHVHTLSSSCRVSALQSGTWGHRRSSARLTC